MKKSGILLIGLFLLQACSSNVHNGPEVKPAEPEATNFMVSCRDFSGKTSITFGLELAHELAANRAGLSLSSLDIKNSENLPKLTSVDTNKYPEIKRISALFEKESVDNVSVTLRPHYFISEVKDNKSCERNLPDVETPDGDNANESSGDSENLEVSESSESSETSSRTAMEESFQASDNDTPYAYSLELKFTSDMVPHTQIYVLLRKFLQIEFEISDQTGKAIRPLNIHANFDESFFATISEVTDHNIYDSKTDGVSEKNYLCQSSSFLNARR